MRFILRIIGTWLLGVTVILLVMDGTKSLAASALVMTGLGDIWTLVHANSLAYVEQVFEEKGAFYMVWRQLLLPMLSWPGWAVLGIPGLILIASGRARS